MAEDDFAAQLGSLDEDQLQALLNEMGSRNQYGFAMGRPGVPAPSVRQGAFQDPTKNADGTKENKNSAHYQETILEEPSVWHQYKKYTGRKKDKKGRRAYDEAMESENQRQKQIMGERMKMVQGQIRTVGMRKKVNTQFRDMDLEGLFDRVTKQGLDSSLIGITQQHEDLSRNTGFQAAAQGLGGGSVDAERIADVQSSQDQASAQAAAQAQMHNRQLRTSADQTRQSLLNSVSGSNPGEEARLNGEMANLQNSANSFVNQAGLTQYGMGQNQQQAAGQSQALGGLLSNYANMYTTNNSGR